MLGSDLAPCLVLKDPAGSAPCDAAPVMAPYRVLPDLAVKAVVASADDALAYSVALALSCAFS